MVEGQRLARGCWGSLCLGVVVLLEAVVESEGIDGGDGVDRLGSD
jgi:hypothetical protein